jgi:hypothetical protein
MKKLIIIIIFLSTTFNSFSQIKVDTLVIGSKKFPLKKVETFYVNQNGPVDLPSEYEKLNDYSKKTKLDYKIKKDKIEAVELLEDGSEVMFKKNGICNTTDNYINLFSFADTINLTYKEFSNLKPYIKTNTSKLNFITSKVSCIMNDTVTEVNHRNMTNGGIFAYWRANQTTSNSEINKIKQTVFVLQELYYISNNSIFYLDREFIIIVK